MDKQELRAYLEQVRQLESDIYTMERTIATLQGSMKPEPIKKQIAPPVKRQPVEPQRDNSQSKSSSKSHKALATGAGLLVMGPIGAIAGYALAKGSEKKSKESDRAYEEAMMQYQQDLARCEYEYQEALKQYHLALQEEEQHYQHRLVDTIQFNNRITGQIDAVRTSKAATANALQTMYNIGILYSKYRSYVPVCMFCEYLDSGRRTELEGTNGMYDLYEAELLGQKIVGGIQEINDNLSGINYQLGILSTQLTAIQQNQIILYKEVAQSNQIAEKIGYETVTILENIQQTQNNAAQSIQNIVQSASLTAFNAAAAARRADALASIAERERAEKEARQLRESIGI